DERLGRGASGKTFQKTVRQDSSRPRRGQDGRRGSRDHTTLKYVGRGGLKLEAALGHFQIDPQDTICLDVGASTGGFTDCLLKAGAKKVYAVDVGYGQFDWTLRNDPRVVLIERQNIRHLRQEKITEPVNLVVIDVSFVSLKLVFPVVKKFLASQSQILALIKPNFEVEPKHVGKKGVVKDPALHEKVVEEIKAAGIVLGWRCQGTCPSPLLGAQGNREFFVYFKMA
ncbi:MAG: TlyA family RNA methyltransferase, partial [Deltaproteobacteria bacterium]|nr:TlyA family RNA methyltransferase [Deltaproteobacteria bacterium]